MIAGSATIAGTTAHAQKYNTLKYSTLGRTQWKVSQAGFGCYRVSAGIDKHFNAMAGSLSSGINVIDTSANYTDGGSERLVGQVLQHMISKGDIAREAVVIVSKVGYLQGRNLVRGQERRKQGNPFPDLVPYGKGLAHCIHPEFIQDQLSRSLERLGLETLDLFLLHNPEYYLGWAAKQGHDVDDARETFYQRIGLAFEFLEEEVSQGRIQAYGVSANTFPASDRDPEFVSLERVWRAAQDVSKNHHFRVVQFPMNLYETGAVLEKNQSDGRSVLDAAHSKQLGVLINRPLNAFAGNRLVRLAEVEKITRHTDDDVIQAINSLNKSEKVLWRKLLPAMDLPMPLYRRIKDQASVGDQLKHYWRNFGSYERWRQFKDELLWPYMQGVFDFLESYAGRMEALEKWLASHKKRLDIAIRAVGSLYVGEAEREIAAIKLSVVDADKEWRCKGTLSQLALRVLWSTAGINTVLVGMRRADYVDDVLEELKRNVDSNERVRSWSNVHLALTKTS